ncbi:large subunit GTPase 1 homolog [Spodoptera litura]|uniref:Large subunit GTPase 1 homolog n=1 Tax=Spodoptera litura TaxID=69820 RepID=A0A9J7EKX2_SPOLT|nr:large subunit GTPase 1 homolog [Spodoptera litura]
MGKKNKDSLGRALIKDRFAKNRHRKHVEDNTMLHTTEVNDGYDWGRLNLQSVTAESSLQEFLSTAELAQREFTAEKLNLKYVNTVPSEVAMATSQPNFDQPLTVPRRPPWHPGISAEDQLNREREVFLEWRRHLNELQASLGAAVTPYERNLELWKQLWRTLEKSDVVLLLLDARNPLLFRYCVLFIYCGNSDINMDHEELLRILEGVDDGIEIESASDSEIEDEFEAVLTENLPASNPPNVQDESDIVENIPGPPPIQWTRQPFGIETPFFDDFGSGISPSLNLTSSSNELAVFEKFVDEELIKTIIRYTNRYHCYFILNTDLRNHSRLQTWKDFVINNSKNHLFQNVSIIFFSAAKETNERKISEVSEESTHEPIDSETDSAISDTEDHNLDDDSVEKEALKHTEEDIELFKRQLGDLDKAVNVTADRIDRIQEILDRVVENLRLGKPIEDYPVKENTDNNESTQIEDNETKVRNSHEVFDREKLLEVLKSQKVDRLKNPPRLSVGMIGYPNVGKSSSVNVLMKTKKVSVSSMPGHTRHIQSLILDEDIELLDCPGLVLPAYAVAPDLLLTAVLPIDQMRAHDAAMARLCQLVSKHTFAEKYGLLLPEDDTKEPDYKQILTAHAFNRGFMTAAGQPDQSRSARIMLKEAASGRLRWAQLPPGCEPQPLDDMLQERKKNEKRKPTPREARMVEGWLNKSNEIDKAFFAMQKSAAHVKGKPVLGIAGAQSADTQLSKPWKQEKKHANKNKREKLRRKYAHLDEH